MVRRRGGTMYRRWRTVLYLTLLTPVLAIPALLLMERLEAWAQIGVAASPSVPVTHRHVSPARGSSRRHAMASPPPVRQLVRG